MNCRFAFLFCGSFLRWFFKSTLKIHVTISARSVLWKWVCIIRLPFYRYIFTFHIREFVKETKQKFMCRKMSNGDFLHSPQKLYFLFQNSITVKMLYSRWNLDTCVYLLSFSAIRTLFLNEVSFREEYEVSGPAIYFGICGIAEMYGLFQHSRNSKDFLDLWNGSVNF